MDLSNSNTENKIRKFHIPRWHEFPSVDLYIDQVVSLLENSLSDYIKNDNDKDDKVITKTMINNYVKHNVITPPINKKYNKEHLAYLFVVFILKQIYSIGEIKKLIDLAINTSPIEKAYDLFCYEVEKAITLTFAREDYSDNTKLTEEQYILRNVVKSFANKLYVQNIYLKNL